MPEIIVRLVATTMEGRPLQDPSVRILVNELNAGYSQIVGDVTINDFNGTATFSVELEENAQPVWQMVADFSLFDAGHSFSFFPGSNANPRWTLQAARLPGKWQPNFTPFASLPSPCFDSLKKCISASSSCDLKNGETIGDLQTHYDRLVSPATILAKAALLNLYAVLTEELDPERTDSPTCWFRYVKKFVRLDQERFVAEVEPGLFESVTGILNQLGGKYAGQGYSTEPPTDFPLHYPNIPVAYGGNGIKRPANLVQMITLKKRYRQGDVQLTVSYLHLPNGDPVHLLDCDMDEHDNIVGHSFDLLAHLFGHTGTNPIYMHEFIEEDSAFNHGGIAAIDLGYDLLPIT